MNRRQYVALIGSMLSCLMYLHTANAQRGVSIKESAHALIEDAYARGEVSKDQWAIYQTYALFDQARLPVKYHSDGTERCATWIVDEIMRSWNTMSVETKEILMRYRFRADGTMARPAGLDSSRSSAHFKIHYSVAPDDSNSVDPIDGNGNGTPDYVDTVMTEMEYVWEFELSVGGMGYVEPPPDDPDGGDALFDVYLLKLNAGDYGLTYRDRWVRDNPNSPYVTEINAHTSYLAMRNNYVGFSTPQLASIRVTAAHEYYHAIENGYDGFVLPWMKEATATWVEDEVYTSINDNYQYLSSWFAKPWIPLEADPRTADSLVTYSTHWYGSWIFFRYLSEHVADRDLIRTIWEDLVNYDNYIGGYTFAAMGDALATQATSFRDVFTNFTVANRIRTVAPFDYTEGYYYPAIGVCQLRPDTTITDTLLRHAARYYWIKPNGLDTVGHSLQITFTPLDTAAQLGTEVITRTGIAVQQRVFNQKTTFIASSHSTDTVVVVVMNYDFAGTTKDYRLEVVNQTCAGGHQYSLTELAFPNGGDTYANKINGSGLVVGTGLNSAGFLHGFVYDRNGVHDLDSLHPTTSGNAISINNAGTVLGVDGSGFFTLTSNGVKTFINSTITQGPVFAAVGDINDLGQIVGGGYINPDSNRALLYSGGTVTVLRTDFDNGYHAHSFAKAINNVGGIVGVEADGIFGAGNAHPMKWQVGGGNGIWLDPAATDVRDMNDNGIAVGSIVVYSGVYPFSHAALLQGGGTTDIGVLAGLTDAEAYAINNVGKVVGSSFDYDQFPRPGRAVIWENGVMKDLNCLVEHDTGWVLQVASDINDAGQIAGWGIHNGVTKGFILTPDGYDPPLPIQLISFTATVVNQSQVRLSWTTLSEINNYGFEVQTSDTSQQHYQTIANSFTPGHGTTNEPQHYSYLDSTLTHGAWYYRLKQTDLDGTVRYSDGIRVNTLTDVKENGIPTVFSLAQNFPNPFNPSTTIKYDLPKDSRVSLKVFNILGQEVVTLVNGEEKAGFKSSVWNASGVASGVYFYKLDAGNFTSVKKLFLLK